MGALNEARVDNDDRRRSLWNKPKKRSHADMWRKRGGDLQSRLNLWETLGDAAPSMHAVARRIDVFVL